MLSAPERTSSRRFIKFAFATTFLTLGLILFGAIVRVTDSGLGCGNHWPLCDGSIFPPLDNITAWIEWLHRLFALLIGVLGIIMLILAFQAYRKQNRIILIVTAIAAVLFFVQSLLGALTVALELPPTIVTLHLGTAMLLLGALLVAAMIARFKPTAHYEWDNFTALAIITAALSLVIILTGALVRGSGATLACIDWPLCNNTIFPAGQGQGALIHMTHRYAVLALGVSLGILLYLAYKLRQDRRIRMLTVLSLVGYLVQAGIGALFVLTRAAPLWGSLHVGFAALTWAILVALCAVEWLNCRPIKDENEEKWQHNSATLTS